MMYRCAAWSENQLTRAGLLRTCEEISGAAGSPDALAHRHAASALALP